MFTCRKLSRAVLFFCLTRVLLSEKLVLFKKWKCSLKFWYVEIQDAEEQAKEEWFRNLSAVLLGNGQKSFLEAISKCLGSDSSELVRVCLTTVAWLSSALSSLSDAEFQLSAFSALISRLRDNLENSEQIEHKILASASLLSFSKIPGNANIRKPYIFPFFVALAGFHIPTEVAS